MSVIRSVVLFALLGVAPAQAEVIDLSRPMTGKATSVFNWDGTPVEMGVPAPKKEVARPEPPRREPPPVAARATPSEAQTVGAATPPAGAASRSSYTLIVPAANTRKAVPPPEPAPTARSRSRGIGIIAGGRRRR